MRISDWSSDVCSSDLPAARPQFPYDGRGQKKGDAHRRQMPVGRAVRFVQPVGVGDRDGGRKRGGTLMMVDDDHLHAAVPCGRERLERLRAAIDGDDKPRALRSEENRSEHKSIMPIM